jgi:hypothetical protein
MPPTPPDEARAEVTQLVPLHEQFAKQLGALRLSLCEAEASRSVQLYEKALRYERLVGRLENRIRVATLSLTQLAEFAER